MLVNGVLDLAILIVNAHTALQDAAFLDGRAGQTVVALGGLKTERVAVRSIAGLWTLRREVGDGVWRRVLDANAGDADVAGLSGLAEGVVAAVKVFALLTLFSAAC